MKRVFLFVLVIAVGLINVSCRQGPSEVLSWERLAGNVSDPESIADMSAVCTEIRTSYDRSGGNNDFGNGTVSAGDGWLQLADFEGPGFVSRFWFTGVTRASVFRFMFDDESEPRLEVKCGDFYSGASGFPASAVREDQNCFTSYFPVPYGKRLRILVSDDGYTAGKHKLYYQINASRLPPGQTVSSAVFPVPEPVRAATDAAFSGQRDFGASFSVRNAFSVPPGGEDVLFEMEAEGVLRGLRIEPEGWRNMSYDLKMSLMRDVLIRIFWEQESQPSVCVPLGDFFGLIWEPRRLDTLYLNADDDGMEILFPMPFRKSIRVSLINYGNEAFAGCWANDFRTAQVSENYGYFHAEWRRTGAEVRGKKHAVLGVSGKGRFAGCFLGVASMDKSFWVLESDETLLADGGKALRWQGTGLEDYFNGGWYYRTLFSEPCYGLTLKRPFRTVQYRMHLQDAVVFNRHFTFDFERGPSNVSGAVFDSTAYYYLERPRAADSSARPAKSGQIPPDEFSAQSLMTRLWDYERVDDRYNAAALCRFAREYRNYPDQIDELLRLRELEYKVSDDGYEAVGAKYHEVAESGASAAEHAKRLIRYHEDGASLISLFSNRKSRLFIDGRLVLQSSSPVAAAVEAVDLTAGRHVIVVETEVQKWPDWVQVALKSGAKTAGTDKSWRAALDPEGDIHSLEYDDSAWHQKVGVVKGPPEMEAVPFVYPDPYVNLQSQVEGIRAVFKNYSAGQQVVYRKVIEID